MTTSAMIARPQSRETTWKNPSSQTSTVDQPWNVQKPQMPLRDDERRRCTRAGAVVVRRV